ncbi:MAG: N-acetyl-beta-hexosaminidase [Planctomycetota bacterium]|jgi:N-acetyl-beta-hexosaminidase
MNALQLRVLLGTALVFAALSGTANAQTLAADPAFGEQSRLLVESLQKLGATNLSLAVEAEAASLQLRQGTLPKGVSYSIEAKAGSVTVVAGSTAGAAYAAADLIRRARIENSRATWEPFQVSEGPDCDYRSFMVDLGRNPHSPETLRQVVDMLWFYRANILHLHLTDDQLISWPSKAFPLLYEDRAGWTWEDFVELEAYSQARGVTIVPELDVPGHSTILRRAYPEVFGETAKELAESPKAQAGVERLIDEMLSVFKATPYVHIGGDEAGGVPEELQRDFINRINAFVKTSGRRTVVWEGPRLGSGENKVSEDVIHINWRTINFPAQEMLDAGYEIVNAAWDPMYIVDHYPRTMFTAVGVRECFLWEPRRFKHVNEGMPTFGTPHVTKTAQGILGFCMPWWEGREQNLMALCLPRFAAAATAAWDLERETGYAGFARDYGDSLPRFLILSGVELDPLPMAAAETQVGNLAFGRPVVPSAGASQPHFGPQRLTNGLTDQFDHFLGYPTKPDPLEILIPLDGVHPVDRVVVFETAIGGSFEKYRVQVSVDGLSFLTVGESHKGDRGEAAFLVHQFEPRPVAFVKIITDGCHDLTFPSFSRLVEVQAFGAE